MRGDRVHNLAIETSGRAGSIALGRGDEMLAERELGEHRRHNVALVTGIDALCAAHDVEPADLGELYVSIGPGSFTGLRVAVAAAKMVALAHGARIVAVPTLEALAQNAPADVDRVAAGLNLKRDRLWAAVFERRGAELTATGAAGLYTLSELVAQAGPGEEPLALLGEVWPEVGAELASRVRVLPGELARVRASAVWRGGGGRAGQF
ncbi:MAG: tRNA (adenosine(37)-N6)-threonylcarbamoyltransferase complex dimerization subunit type 1 TsaB, partial [Phycisphaeraceae bacterium]